MTRQEAASAKRKRITRIICLALAVVMCVTIVASAVFAQIW